MSSSQPDPGDIGLFRLQPETNFSQSASAPNQTTNVLRVNTNFGIGIDGHLVANPQRARASLTAYRLLNLILIIGLGVLKAILTAQGGSAAPSTLDWLIGVVCAAG